MRLVRAVYDFSTTIPGEISLRQGDLVAVTAVVNADWLQGRSVDSRQGIFPSNFVEDVPLPELHRGNRLFVAKEDFAAMHPGDLTLQKGDVIVGVCQVDTNWWSGRSGSIGKCATGIFPLTFVMPLPFELDDQAMPMLTGGRQDERAALSAASAPGVAEGHLLQGSESSTAAAAATPGSSSSGSSNGSSGSSIGSTIVRKQDSGNRVSSSACSVPAGDGSSCLYRVQAQMDAVAQLPDELGFRKGDVLTVLRVVNDDWYYGECKGKRGSFLRSLVERLADDSSAVALPAAAARNFGGSSSSSNGSSSPAGCASASDGSRRLLPAAGPASSASVCARLEKSRVPICDQRSSDGCDEAVQHNARRCRALYPFAARSSDELSFSCDDVITNVEDAGGAWCRGRLGTNTGIFPASYVQFMDGDRFAAGAPSTAESEMKDSVAKSSDSSIVRQLPLAQPVTAVTADLGGTDDERAAARAAASRDSATRAGATPVRSVSVALHSFRAEAAGEISLERGDTVVVLRELGDGWCEVSLGSDKSGLPKRGLCPVAYLSEPLGQVRPRGVADGDGVPGVRLSSASAADAAVAATAHPASGRLSKLCESDSTVVASATPENNIAVPSASWLSTDQPAMLRQRAAAPASRRSWSPASSLDDVVAAEMAKLKAKPPVPLRPASIVGTASHRAHSKSSKAAQSPLLQQPAAVDIILHRKSDVPMSPAAVIESDDKAVTPAALGTSLVVSELVSSSSVEETSSLVKPCVSLAGAAEPRSAAEPADVGTAPVDSSAAVAVSEAASTSDVVDSALALTATDARSPDVTDGALAAAVPPSGDSAAVAIVGPTRSVPPPLPPSLRRTTSATKLVPSRPAPPVPASRGTITESVQAERWQTSESAKKMDAAIAAMESNSVIAANSHGHAVTDLKNRIALLENDIKDMTAQLENIQCHSMPEDGVQEDVDFYMSNINGMAAEMAELKESLRILLSSATSDETISTVAADLASRETTVLPTVTVTDDGSSAEAHHGKMKEQREKVIVEIKSTEESYLRDLHLSMKYFMSPDGPKHPDVDIETLFGNMEEVATVSQKFLERFESHVSSKPFKEQCVGLPFVELADDMKKAYSVYCRNHDDVCVLLERYEEDDSIQAQFNRVLDLLRAETVVFDVGSFLIKPVQRILKYPLLLKELIKCTEDGHPDKAGLLQALDAVTDVASAINEYKRRKDLVYKYRKEKFATLSDKMASLNMHSVRKKSARLGMRLTATLGLSHQTKDTEFDREEASFRGIERTIKTFLKEIVSHLQLLEKCTSAQERLAASIRELYREKAADEVTSYVETQQIVVAELFKSFRNSVEVHVLLPLTKLTAYYQGPSNVIQKRGDKLLDYDNCQLAYERAKDTDQAAAAKQDLMVAQKDYEALNQQLLVELPNLTRLSSLILTDGIGYYVNCYKQYIRSILAIMYPLLQMPQLSTQGRPVMECFTASHDVVAAMVTRLCTATGPSSASVSTTRSSFLLPLSSSGTQQKPSALPQSAESREQLIARYPADRLYVVSSMQTRADGTSGGTADMDLAVELGHVVAVLKTKDPMGGSERWFVDNGTTKGFVLSSCLQPLSVASRSAASSASSSPATSPRCLPGDGRNEEQHRPDDVGPQLATALSSPPAATENRHLVQHLGNASDSGTPHQSHNRLQQELQKATLPVSPRSSSPVVCEMEYWCALYSFSGRNSNEADLVAGQPVVVLQKHDVSGNSSWWLVESGGRCGYAPCNYLATYQPQPTVAASPFASSQDRPPPYLR